MSLMSLMSGDQQRRSRYTMRDLQVRRLGGWALLINAVLTLLILITMTTSVGGVTFILLIGEVLSPLLVVGLMAIWAMQPHAGRLGQIGLIGVWCLGIATGIAFLVRLAVLVGSVDVGDFIPLSSALFGLVGSILLGWATIQAKVFHPAIGWLLIAGGVLNFVGGLLPPGAGALLVSILTTILQTGAVGGYGWTMLHSAQTAQRAPEQPIGGQQSGHQASLK
jgi:hypothetical protein